jgi:hypothetical protein
LEPNEQTTTRPPAKAKKAAKRKPARKKQPRAEASPKPLPPPVDVPEVRANGSISHDAYNLETIFQTQSQPAESPDPSRSSSTSEPRPGEPLSPDSERIVADIGAGDEPADDSPEPSLHAPEGPGDAFTKIAFDEGYVADVLEEAYAWAAEKFDSDHWNLTERQSRMLSGPTTELLGSMWMHLQRILPEILARWASSTPGLMDFALMFGLITGPKAAKQFALSRARRRGPQRPRRPGAPVPVPPRSGGAVGPIQVGVETLEPMG